MVESFLLLCVITVVILAIRRGKPIVLDNPVIIYRPGQYHITLAPQLNCAQTFMENIAGQFPRAATNECATQYFEVRDPRVVTGGEGFYLLAAALRGGVLYLQAINPQPLLHDADSHLKTVREFSDKVMALHPLIGVSDEHGVGKLQTAVGSAASQLQIGIKPMFAGN
jgi:hypothetical protein